MVTLSRLRRAVAAALAVAFLVACSRSSDKKEIVVAPVHDTSTTAFHGIPREGSGGDPGLNRQKNRWTEPAAYREATVAEIVAFSHDRLDDAGRKQRAHWSDAAAMQVVQYEQLGVRVEGILVAAKQSGVESCNGGNDLYRDDHLWLGTAPSDAKRDAIVVEVTPFWNERHPEWSVKTLVNLARRHARIRVSGWILWDQEHADEVGKSRGSQWEVHPITRIEVADGNAWHDLTATDAL